MSSPNPLEDLKRTIALIYGLLASGSPFWAFAAVRTNKYQQFVADQKDGKIDLTQFEAYGEIIICGEGRSPPDEVTLKVAEMYQTDSNTLKSKVEQDAAAAKQALDAALGEKKA